MVNQFGKGRCFALMLGHGAEQAGRQQQDRRQDQAAREQRLPEEDGDVALTALAAPFQEHPSCARLLELARAFVSEPPAEWDGVTTFDVK